MAADAKLLLDSLLRANNSSLHLLLESVNCSQSLQIKSVAHEWIAKTNTLLNSTKDRWMGVCLLAQLIEQCDTEIFLENCLSWLKILTRVFQQEKQNDKLSKYIAETFAKILSFSTQLSELSREIASSVIPTLLTTLLNDKPNLYCEVSLTLIKSCIQYYPGPCGSFWKRIETLLLQVFNSDNISLSQVASVCFAILPKCGNTTGTGVDKQSASWELQWRKIISTLSSIINDLYSNYQPENSFQQNSTILDLDPIPVVEPQRTETCVFRIEFLFKCLTLMLRSEFTKSVNLPVNATIKLVQIVLAVNETSIANHVAIESVLLKSTLPAIHISALNFLIAFIESCKMSLLPYNQILIKTFLLELSWTTSDRNTSGFQQMFGKLRSTIYEGLQLWIFTTGSLGEQNDIAKKIVSHLINDIKPHTTATKLLAPTSSSSKNVSNSKKAKRRRVQDDVNQLTRTQEKVDHFANAELCISGLKALRVIVSKTSSDLPPQILKEIQVLVVTLLLQCSSSSSNFTFPIPYESTECRKLLYHLLQSLLYNHNPSCPPPVQHALRIFSQGIQDQCLEVSQFCTEAQMICNILIHPRVAVLASPVILQQQEVPMNEHHNEPLVTSINKRQKNIEMNTVSDTEMALPNTSGLSQEIKDKCEESLSMDAGLIHDSPLTIVQDQSRQSFQDEVLNNGSKNIAQSNVTPGLLDTNHEHTKRLDMIDKTSADNVDISLHTTVSKSFSGEKVHEITNERCLGDLLPDSQDRSHSENYDNVDLERHPPAKKRRTSDINSNNMEKPNNHIADATMETKEDEELAKEIIASFVDSVPDSD